MRTTAQDVREAEILDARLLALHAEKARVDAEIASTTEDMRQLFEQQLLEYQGVSPIARRTNLADVATATSIACLLRISERAAHRLVQHSSVLVKYQPATHQALRDGLISWQHATTIIDECTGLPAPTAGILETELLTLAKDTTTARLAHQSRKLRTRFHPETLDSRARTATERRRVDVDPAHDAMAWLHVYLPATDATAIDARLTHTARTLQTPTEHRTLTQLRTDILVDLLLASPGAEGCAGGVRANVNVTVPVLTLLGVADEPADLEGYGPIPADTARRLAAHAPSFTRLLTHPETGVVLSVGRTTYSVPADLKKWLRVRDRTCRHPGCNIPASRCELDHTTPWSHQGLTNHNNLAHLCRKHHALKTAGVWRYAQHTPEKVGQRGQTRQHGGVKHCSGVLAATSPTGRTYLSHPDPPPF